MLTLYAIFIRTWLKTIRRPVVLSFSLVQPLLWMLFFGFLFHRYNIDALPVKLSYLDFLTPGVCAMTVLFGASQAGIEFIRDMNSGLLYRILETPAAKIAVMLSKIAADSSRLLIQAALVIGLAIALAAQLQFALMPILYMLAGMALFAIAFCSLSCLIALTAKSQENMATFVHLINMPMLFTSTALVPSKQMPDWLAEIAQYNPLSLVVNNNRNALLSLENPEMQMNLIILAIFAGCLFFLATISLYTLKRS